MKTVLLTGANGFIGRHAIQPLLDLGYVVHAVYSRHSIHPEYENCIWHQCDLSDINEGTLLIESIRPTHFLHFAWYMEPSSYLRSLHNFEWVDISFNLYKKFIDSGGERAVISGSCFEYDLKYGFCSEYLTPLSNENPYNTCKNVLHNLIRSYSGVSENSSYAWGRIFYSYGPHEKGTRLVPSIINSLISGEIAQCSHGNQMRDYLHVADVASAMVVLLDSSVEGPVNIASGIPVSIKEIANLIEIKMGKEYMINFGGIKSPENEPPLVVGDTTRLRKELNWTPSYSLEKGLEDTISWWKTK